MLRFVNQTKRIQCCRGAAAAAADESEKTDMYGQQFILNFIYMVVYFIKLTKIYAFLSIWINGLYPNISVSTVLWDNEDEGVCSPSPPCLVHI